MSTHISYASQNNFEPFSIDDDNFPPPEAALGICQRQVHEGGVDAWLDHCGYDIDMVRAVTHIGTMRGYFMGCLGFPFPSTFRPCPTCLSKAIVFPLHRNGEVIDILAIDKADERSWGVVTGAAGFVNEDAIGASDEPLTVHRTPESWLQGGCRGVVPLRWCAMPMLQRASFLVAEDPEHADDLVERVWTNPATDWVDYLNAASEGSERVGVDMDDDEFAATVARRAASELARRVAG